MILKDEKRFIQANTVTTLWGISIRNKDGSYRTPKKEELDELLEIYEAARECLAPEREQCADAQSEELGNKHPPTDFNTRVEADAPDE